MFKKTIRSFNFILILDKMINRLKLFFGKCVDLLINIEPITKIIVKDFLGKLTCST